MFVFSPAVVEHAIHCVQLSFKHALALDRPPVRIPEDAYHAQVPDEAIVFAALHLEGRCER